MATTLQLTCRSSILGPSLKALTPPDLLEQIRYYLFWKSETQKLPAGHLVRNKSDEAGWRNVGDDHIPIWFESKLMANCARYFELMRGCGKIRSWKYQPRAFKMKGVRGSFTPDFLIGRIDGSSCWMDIDRQDDDIKRYEKRIYFEIEYPDEEILDADTGWLEENIEIIKRAIPEWE
jgi:hypothetical protein